MSHWAALLHIANCDFTQLPLLGTDQHHSLAVGRSWDVYLGRQPDAENAFKVRLSIRTALGDKAYAWDANEEYLFKAMVAFSMRKVPNRETTEISHVLLCNVTKRVSFWFVVTDPSKNHTLPADEVQSAIRMNRNRINNAFSLNDQTLEFLKIPSTLAPPTEPSVPTWIITFGVMFCIVIVAITLLVLSGIRQRRRKNKEPSEVDDTEDKCENAVTIENGIPCDPLDMKGGHINDTFMTENERLTSL
ncbi:collectrin isoform X1 [Rousettus aegyptiacus]|uniref:collectrin isoform X1 n=1 Tax=Rousettus aegyptiacus TaxID=9407 RepID=UPI00168D1465|nr:collectrin isoform X1 [Rousettus aegyptiacus]